jgi:hypothetical protein
MESEKASVAFLENFEMFFDQLRFSLTKPPSGSGA